MVPWSEFERQETEFAGRVGARFRGHPHHVLGTIKPDGSPRLSGINVNFRDGHLWIGSMPGALKAADLDRDPRIALHSAPLSGQMEGGDVRIEGRARRVDEETARAWLPEGGAGEAFSIGISRVHMVEVVGRDLVITVWEPGEALRIVTRQ